MQLGIFAKTFAGAAPAAVLGAAAGAGYRVVQYNMACSGLPSMPDDIPDWAARAVADAAEAAGVGIAAVSGTFNMIHPNRIERAAGLRRLEVIASACKAMKTRMITLCTGTRDPADQWRHHPDNDSKAAWADLMGAMTVAIDIAERHDVDLGIEPELANVVSSAEKARALIDDLASPRLRIVIDAANLFERETVEDQRGVVSRAVDLLADRIAMAHAKDRAADGGFVAAGAGVLDYEHYLTCLKEIGFSGPLITHGLSAEEAPATSAFLRAVMQRAGVGPA
jgi:sugar phosphate isomerase/epimerase